MEHIEELREIIDELQCKYDAVDQSLKEELEWSASQAARIAELETACSDLIHISAELEAECGKLLESIAGKESQIEADSLKIAGLEADYAALEDSSIRQFAKMEAENAALVKENARLRQGYDPFRGNQQW